MKFNPVKGALRATTTAFAVSALMASSTVLAQDNGDKESSDKSDSGSTNLVEMQKDASNWLMWSGQYNGQRYSELDQITAENASELAPAWTFSTGVLRGHEGGPLV